jgi:glycosyltransferase involved in cell wall biosynthesis
MKWWQRKNGISVLIPTQNEEAIVGLCLLSFLDFGDELIVVDNGSTDRTKGIVRELQARYPHKIQFFDVPELPDLYHNRQYAFSKSKYRWVVRLDSDYVAYTDGEFNILNFREKLLSQKREVLPRVYAVPQPNVTGDFWHTGIERERGEFGPNAPGRYVPAPISGPMIRVYEVFPGFQFKRLGRWEGVRFQRILNKLKIDLDYPLWMHCNLKSNRNHLFRSERTNWRQLGDYQRYPTLDIYVREMIMHKFNTNDIEQAAAMHFERNIMPMLQGYDPERFYPYPWMSPLKKLN